MSSNNKKALQLGGYKGLQINHCHITNKIRGLLCPTCNTGIGRFKESQLLFKNAIDYLIKHDSLKM